MENKRYRQRGEIEVDMHFASEMMDELVSKTKIKKGTWITSKKIKEVTARMQNNDEKTNRRIALLVKSGFLKNKPMSKKMKIEKYGTAWRNDYIYTIGCAGTDYLKHHGTFLNKKGYLTNKGNRKYIERENIEMEYNKQQSNQQSTKKEDEYSFDLR